MPALGSSETRPMTLGRYELVALIGRGGMAEVHLAVQRGPAGFEKLVVVKLVHAELASQASFVEMLADEARHAGLVKHPNVVEVYELGEADGRRFIAMEYLEGEPLLDVLRLAGEGAARLDPLSVARVIADAAEGLDAAHRLKGRDGRPLELVHHDVSLGNIVVLYSGLVKLVDFGVAKARSAERGDGRVQGKLGYMSPEKIRDAAVDRRSDLWSLGCVLWEALTLQRLFKGDTDKGTVDQVLAAEIPRPSEVDPSVPAELDPIVMRALERDPDRRYQTAKAMAAELEEVLRERKYGARNDRIAQHMEAVFAARIAARERVLMAVSNKRRPSAATLEVAFGEAFTPAAPAPPPQAPAPPPADEAAAPPPRDGRQLSPGAFSQPRPRQSGGIKTPKPFSVASLLDDPDAASAEPIRPDEPLLLRDRPSSAPQSLAPQSLAPQSLAPQPPAPQPPAPLIPAPPVVPSPPAPGRAGANPFDEDDNSQTVADVIPANAEASRSLQSEPSWTIARQSASLGELQRWVQESRTPPRSRWEAVVRHLRPLHHRVEGWAHQRRLPGWSPYAAAGAVLLALVLLLARCGGGSDERAQPGAAEPPPPAAPDHEEIQMEEDVVRPPKR